MDIQNEWIAGGISALVAGVLALRRFIQNDRVKEANSKAETDVVTMLRAEVSRLAESNANLSKQVQNLMQANMALQGTVHELQMQVKSLTPQFFTDVRGLGDTA